MRKLYYSISEVSKIIAEEQHILRYWEKEFDILRPRKNRAGNRIYSEKDLNILKMIKYLLRQKKISLRSVKDYLTKNYEQITSQNIENLIILNEQKRRYVTNDVHENENKIFPTELIIKLEEIKGSIQRLLKILD